MPEPITQDVITRVRDVLTGRVRPELMLTPLEVKRSSEHLRQRYPQIDPKALCWWVAHPAPAEAGARQKSTWRVDF